MKTLFRVDCSPTIGSGHMARSLTLASALRSLGSSVTIATRSPSDHTRGWVERTGCALTELRSDDDDLTATLGAADDADLVVFDGYEFTCELHDGLRRPERSVCVIDDNATAPIGGDIVLNGNFHGDELDYDRRLTRLVGSRYALLRGEFARARAAYRERVLHAPPRLLVTMGGADPARATLRVLAAIAQLETMDVRVAIGAENPSADEICAEAARLQHHRVVPLRDVRDMAGLMLWCDVAISAAGSTCLELACVGVPAIVFAIAENQKRVAATVQQRGLMQSLGTVDELASERLAAAIRNLLRDDAHREAMARLQREAVDGGGARRAAEGLMEVRETSHGAGSMDG